MLILCYENAYKENQPIYVFVIPVYSELNNKWYNNIGYSMFIDDYQLSQQIGDMLFSEFANANSLYEEQAGRLSPEQISSRLKQRFTSAINGHG